MFFVILIENKIDGYFRCFQTTFRPIASFPSSLTHIRLTGQTLKSLQLRQRLQHSPAFGCIVEPSTATATAESSRMWQRNARTIGRYRKACTRARPKFSRANISLMHNRPNTAHHCRISFIPPLPSARVRKPAQHDSLRRVHTRVTLTCSKHLCSSYQKFLTSIDTYFSLFPRYFHFDSFPLHSQQRSVILSVYTLLTLSYRSSIDSVYRGLAEGT